MIYLFCIFAPGNSLSHGLSIFQESKHNKNGNQKQEANVEPTKVS